MASLKRKDPTILQQSQDISVAELPPRAPARLSSLATASSSGVTAAPVRWEVMPGWEALLLDEQGLRLPEWLANGSAVAVKHGVHRTVYRVDLAERSVYLKHYRCSGTLAAGGNLLRWTASRREWFKALEADRREIPTAKPVAFGEQMQYGLVRDSYVITEAIPNAISLEDYLAQDLPGYLPEVQARCRRRLLRGLARLCAAAHCAGVYHNDFHTGNILVQADTITAADWDDGDASLPRLHLIDLPGVRFSGALDWDTSRDSLVMLGADWLKRSSRAERLLFWHEYLAARPSLRLENPRAAAADVAQRMTARFRRVTRARDKRALRDNRSFYQVSHPRVRGFAVRDVTPEVLNGFLTAPEQALHADLSRPVKLTHTSMVVRGHLPLEHGDCEVAVKRYRARSWWKALLGVVRRGAALRGWYLGHALLERGIATARPLITCEQRGWRLRWDSYLLTEWIAGAENLHLYLWELRQTDATEQMRRMRQLASSLGELVGNMHAWSVSHRDLKGGNIAVVQHEDGVEALLIDLDGVRIRKQLTPELCSKDLARLAASRALHPWITRADCVRFLRAYRRAVASDSWQREAGDWKPLWRRTAVLVTPIVDRLRASNTLA